MKFFLSNSSKLSRCFPIILFSVQGYAFDIGNSLFIQGLQRSPHMILDNFKYSFIILDFNSRFYWHPSQERIYLFFWMYYYCFIFIVALTILTWVLTSWVRGSIKIVKSLPHNAPSCSFSLFSSCMLLSSRGFK